MSASKTVFSVQIKNMLRRAALLKSPTNQTGGVRWVGWVGGVGLSPSESPTRGNRREHCCQEKVPPWTQGSREMMSGSTDQMFSSHLDLLMWRQFYGDTGQHAFHNLLLHVVSYCLMLMSPSFTAYIRVRLPVQ